jgi:hypothetical protein
MRCLVAPCCKRVSKSDLEMLQRLLGAQPADDPELRHICILSSVECTAGTATRDLACELLPRLNQDIRLYRRGSIQQVPCSH